VHAGRKRLIGSGRPLAGVAIILVALFPTGLPGDRVKPTPLQDLLSVTWVQRIHYGSAAIFLISLAVISWYEGP
jgi:hypothetical protein